jgi:acyl-CoA reductase-like NAD-dependent aldehyde dehydrogenase
VKRVTSESPEIVRNLVAGSWNEGSTLDRRSPVTGDIVSSAAQASTEDAEQALEFAATSADEVAAL